MYIQPFLSVCVAKKNAYLGGQDNIESHQEEEFNDNRNNFRVRRKWIARVRLAGCPLHSRQMMQVFT